MFDNLPKVTKNLILANVLIWAGSFVLRLLTHYDLNYTFGLHYFAAQDFYVWQPITYMFMHDNSGIFHIFFNMFALFMFGRMLESLWGPKRFLFYYLFSGIGAGLVQQLVWYFELVRFPDYEMALAAGYLNNFITIGASGAIFAILLAFAITFPNLPLIFFPIPIPIKAKYLMVGYACIELFLGIRSASTMSGSIAHFAHIGGLVFGGLVLLYWHKKYGLQRFDDYE